MKVTVSSKNNEKVFDDSTIINIGTAPNCQFKLDLDFDLILSLRKTEPGKYEILNTYESDKVLFRGQPIGQTLEIGTLCKLMIADSDDFISIKITSGGANPKIVPGSMELANKKNAEKIRKVEKKTLSMIEDEDLNEQDIEALYGAGSGAKTKIKIDKRKDDIERRRALVTKEVAYKANYLRGKLTQNEIVLAFLNFFIVFVPFGMSYILKDVITLWGSNGSQMQNRILFLITVGFIFITMLLKQYQFLRVQREKRGGKNVNQASHLIERLSLFISGGMFMVIIVAALADLFLHRFGFPPIIPYMAIATSALCIILGIMAGFTQNTIADAGEELDSYESREDFQAVVKDYQQWIGLYVNNTTRKKLKDISNKIFNLNIKQAGEYILGMITAPFLAYGVSQTLAECFPEAAGWIRMGDGFKFSLIFWILASFMIILAFHCFGTSFSITKRLYASNVIKQDGFSDPNMHGVMLHGVESSKNLRKEAKKFLLIAVCIVIIEITMNVSYFIGVMGGDVGGMVLSFIAALLPTAILIAETNMLGNTKFEIIIREELLEKVDKDF